MRGGDIGRSVMRTPVVFIIAFASHRLHLLGLEANTVGKYGHRIAAENMLGEDVQCVKDILRHAGPPDRRSQATVLIQN